MGAATRGSLVVRGGSQACRLAAWASHPEELQLQPAEFDLAPGQLAELSLVHRYGAGGGERR